MIPRWARPRSSMRSSTSILDQVRATLKKRPALKELRLDKGVNILQFGCGRFTGDDPAAPSRQLRLAKWLVSEGFNPRENYATAPGDDGEAESARSVGWVTMPIPIDSGSAQPQSTWRTWSTARRSRGTEDTATSRLWLHHGRQFCAAPTTGRSDPIARSPSWRQLGSGCPDPW
jgi:hypothetical protein